MPTTSNAKPEEGRRRPQLMKYWHQHVSNTRMLYGTECMEGEGKSLDHHAQTCVGPIFAEEAAYVLTPKLAK